MTRWHNVKFEHQLARFLWLNFSIFFVFFVAFVTEKGLKINEFPNNNKTITRESPANHP